MLQNKLLAYLLYNSMNMAIKESSKETTNIFAKLFFNNYLFKLAVHQEVFANEKQIKKIVISCEKMDSIKNLE